jgi:hypothetical protein
VSSPASRCRQRQRRRARERLWAAQGELAERHGDFIAYERVIADMVGQGLPPQTRAPLVIACREATRRECERLAKVVADLERTVTDLEPKQEATA